MKTILQDRWSGLYFKGIGQWVSEPETAFGFASCGRAFDYCLRHGFWGMRVILMSDSEESAVVVTLEEPAEGRSLASGGLTGRKTAAPD